MHLPIFPKDFTLLRGKDVLKVYTFETGTAQTEGDHLAKRAFILDDQNLFGC